MKTIGIVAEYNPFHRGHAWHLEESRRLALAAGGDAAPAGCTPEEDTAVIAVMSGDFVQRGEAAVFSKYARAEAACRCGADLVVELPLPWSLSSAEGFARGAVTMLAALGAELISFGSETAGQLPALETLAALLADQAFTEEVRERLKRDPAQSFASARQSAAEARLGRPLPALRQPNNILALEYLKAIREKQLPLTPLAVARRGSGHDEAGESAYPSASELRGRLRDGRELAAGLPPEAEAVFRRERVAGRLAADPERQSLLMLSRLRGLRRRTFLLWRTPGTDSERDCIRRCGTGPVTTRS